MVLTILWQVYMFLSASESIQACQMMKELLGQVMAKLLELHSIALCQCRSKYARKEQWRRGKQSEKIRGQQLQSSFAVLEHFPKSIFYILYTISKLWKSRIKRFKPCMIWSWNEEDMAFGSQLLQVMRKFRITPSKFA